MKKECIMAYSLGFLHASLLVRHSLGINYDMLAYFKKADE